MYIMHTHQKRLIDTILIDTLSMPLFYKNIKELSPFASWPDATIHPQWLELPMFTTYFSGQKDVRAIEVWLYFSLVYNY